MNHKHLLMAATLATLTACATSTPQPVRTASVAPSVAPASAIGAATATPVNYDPRMAESDRKAKEMGYRITIRDGARYYCRTVAPMGTRIPQKECLRVEDIQQQIHRLEEDKMNIRQFQYCGPSCVPPAGAQ